MDAPGTTSIRSFKAIRMKQSLILNNAAFLTNDVHNDVLGFYVYHDLFSTYLSLKNLHTIKRNLKRSNTMRLVSIDFRTFGFRYAPQIFQELTDKLDLIFIFCTTTLKQSVSTLNKFRVTKNENY